MAAATGAKATLAEAVRRHRAAHATIHQPSGPARSLLGLLPLCRSPALGGGMYRCGDCGVQEPRWRSCGNRHCPNCQTKARESWVYRQECALLDVPCFHLVFTLPAELQGMLLGNKAAGYGLLFSTAASTLKSFGSDHGQLGFTAVLHTWNQRLLPHAHLHVLVPSVALRSDGSARRIGKGRFLFPVKALSTVFRARFLAGLKRLQRSGGLRGVSDPIAFNAELEPLYTKDWVVYAKRPFGGPRQVVAYLGRYTHRTAISNQRIRRVDDRSVSFHARDPKNPKHKTTVTLPGHEFLRRFLFHLLPKGFTRIRHFGFLAGGVRKKALAALRLSLGEKAPVPEPLHQRLERICGPATCRHCETGTMTLHRVLGKQPRPPP